MVGEDIQKLLDGIDARQQSIDRTLKIPDLIMRRSWPKGQTIAKHVQEMRHHATSLHRAMQAGLACEDHTHSIRLELGADVSKLLSPSPSSQQFQYVSDYNTHDYRANEERLCISSWIPTQVVFADVMTVSNDSKSTVVVTEGGSAAEVQDLCGLIHTSHPLQPYLELQLAADEGGRGKLKRRFSPTSSSDASRHGFLRLPESFMSLDELLESPPQWEGRPLGVSERQRRLLSSRVPLYVFALMSTPWCSERWTLREIEFLKGTGGPNVSPVDLNRPFIRATSLPSDRLSGTSNGRGTIAPTLPSSHILLLNLCLLLLAFSGARIADAPDQVFSLAQADDIEGQFKLLAALGIWKRRSKDHISAGFKRSLEFCMSSFLNDDFMLTRDEHLESALEAVVLPLSREYELFIGGIEP